VSTLREAWEGEAEDWIAWARSPARDHFFWRLNLPHFLALLPSPGRLTVDVGCGEGRLARELQARGHRVLGVESSPTLAAAARAATPPTEVVEADAAAMPLATASADLAVASMSLLNMDQLDRVVAEVARLLEPGGRFCFSTVHPFNSLGPAGGGYFEHRRFAETRERAGASMTFHDTHRPLRAYFAALERGGLLTEAVREPAPDDDHVAAHPDVARHRERPAFLHVRAVKP